MANSDDWCTWTGSGLCRYEIICCELCGYNIENQKKEPEMEDPRDKIEIVWSIEDVKSVAPDLTLAEMREVLEHVLDEHDANYGVSWSTLEDWADYVREKR